MREHNISNAPHILALHTSCSHRRLALLILCLKGVAAQRNPGRIRLGILVKPGREHESFRDPCAVPEGDFDVHMFLIQTLVSLDNRSTQYAQLDRWSLIRSRASYTSCTTP
ncbi:hypothetical protein GGS24DRAFT_448793 [Hypoxylon argillaceum]|nr:hypothetical protein GGS24DRAFT_448793 [Hypoxylon argillaceum]